MTSTLYYATLMLASTGLMVYAILLAARTIKTMPSGNFLKWWKLLLIFISGLAICYFVFILTANKHELDPLIPLVVAVFFFGIVFVLLTLQLFMHAFISMEKTGWLNMIGILDERSGIYNLRYFDMRLNEEFERASRYNYPLTLFLVEIDRHGKDPTPQVRGISEKIFVTICKLLKDSSRSSDIIARYGDDQLIMLLPNTSLFSSRKAAEKYRSVIEDQELDVDGEDRAAGSARLIYTVSIGISTLQNDVKRTDELVRRADIALNMAKGRGRNRVIIYGE
jgi:diguanylate cyclase (GGDEF)-like protein